MDFIASIMSFVQTIIAAIFIVPIFLLLILITELIPPTIDTDISKYETYRQELNYADEFMPKLDALSDAESIQFAFQETEEFFGIPRTMTLTAYYSDEAYIAAVAAFEATHTFVDAPIIDTDGDHLLDDAFSYRGFDFRSVAPSPNKRDACSYFGLFGTCAEQNCIAWLYYHDVDLDYIAESDEDLDAEMIEMVDEYFHWEPMFE